MVDVAVRKGREGSRWYNERPTGEAVAEWFRTVPLHEGLNHEEFVGGVTLIPAKEKSNEVIDFNQAGLPMVREREDIVYVPYVRVDTRIAYFWKLVELRGWVAEITPVRPPHGQDAPGLPPGFFKYVAAKPDGKPVNFVGCSMKVTVYAPDVRSGGKGRVVMDPPAGSKIVATTTRWDVDMNAVMKAETGAIGRALGMAGILVVPGSGVATAEDMHDATVPAGATPEAEPVLPPMAADHEGTALLSDEKLRERAANLVAELETRSPVKHAAFQEWARGRKLTLADAQGTPLRGVVKKLERTMEELNAEAEAHAA